MSSPFTVFPAKIVGGVKSPIYYPDPNVKPHYGVPLALFSVPGDLLRLEIIPWDKQAVNDSGWLIINKGAPLFMKTIQTGEDGKTFFHDVPKAFLNDGLNTLVVRATNQVQPGGTDSIDLLSLVHIPRPGGEVVGSGNNPNLTLSVSHLSVGPTEAANGVDVTLRYPYMREGDDINLDLDGRAYPHTVTAAQAPLGQVVIKLFAKDFWQDNKQFAIRFRVTDSLGNTSGPLAIWSATTNIDVQVKQPALDLIPPKVLEAKEANGTQLNFEKDFYQNTHATVEVQYTGSNAGQKVRVYCIGRAETYGSETQTVSSAGQKLTFLIPRRVIVDSIANKIQFSYTVILPNTVPERPSKDLDVNITRQKHICGVPTINAARDNLRLYAPNPLEAQYTVRISLTIDGQTRLDSQEIPYVQGSYMDFGVPRGWVSSNPGKTGYFNYSIRRTGSTDLIIFSPYVKVLL